VIIGSVVTDIGMNPPRDRSFAPIETAGANGPARLTPARCFPNDTYLDALPQEPDLTTEMTRSWYGKVRVERAGPERVAQPVPSGVAVEKSRRLDETFQRARPHSILSME
jgi:hypothetical protein